MPGTTYLYAYSVSAFFFFTRYAWEPGGISGAELPVEARRERPPVNLASPPLAVAVAQSAQRVDETAAASVAYRAATGGKVTVATCSTICFSDQPRRKKGSACKRAR